MNLDLEVAMGAAPDATWKVYKAANNLALLPDDAEQDARPTTSTIVSDSWGLCELFVPVKLTANENTALELLAVHDASFYVASGDDGSADCRSSNPGAKFLAIDDPSGQPFATAVGGTNLHARPHGLEKAWRGSGGGISINWPKPEYQVADRTPNVPGGFCASGKAQCRVTPDIAMDAAPQTGYIIRSRGLGAGASGPWGTRRRHERRGAAHGRDHGRRERGRRTQPRLRQPVHLPGTGCVAGDFHDIDPGSNANGTGTNFPAGAGLRPGDRPRLGQGAAAFAAALAGLHRCRRHVRHDQAHRRRIRST